MAKNSLLSTLFIGGAAFLAYKFRDKLFGKTLLAKNIFMIGNDFVADARLSSAVKAFKPDYKLAFSGVAGENMLAVKTRLMTYLNDPTKINFITNTILLFAGSTDIFSGRKMSDVQSDFLQIKGTCAAKKLNLIVVGIPFSIYYSKNTIGTLTSIPLMNDWLKSNMPVFISSAKTGIWEDPTNLSNGYLLTAVGNTKMAKYISDRI